MIGSASPPPACCLGWARENLPGVVVGRYSAKNNVAIRMISTFMPTSCVNLLIALPGFVLMGHSYLSIRTRKCQKLDHKSSSYFSILRYNTLILSINFAKKQNYIFFAKFTPLYALLNFQISKFDIA